MTFSHILSLPKSGKWLIVCMKQSSGEIRLLYRKGTLDHTCLSWEVCIRVQSVSWARKCLFSISKLVHNEPNNSLRTGVHNHC